MRGPMPIVQVPAAFAQFPQFMSGRVNRRCRDFSLSDFQQNL